MPKSGKPVFQVESPDLEDLGRRMRAAARDLSRTTDEWTMEAAKLVAAEARKRASFSRRIPRTIRPRKVGEKAVVVQAGGPSAPHARVFEPARNRDVSHPVYARGPRQGWTWVTQPRRPFLKPALAAVRHRVENLAKRRVDQVLDRLGD